MKKSFLSLLLLSAAFVSAADKKNVLLIAGKPSHGPASTSITPASSSSPPA